MKRADPSPGIISLKLGRCGVRSDQTVVSDELKYKSNITRRVIVQVYDVGQRSAIIVTGAPSSVAERLPKVPRSSSTEHNKL